MDAEKPLRGALEEAAAIRSEILKADREFVDMIRTDGWKRYVKMLDEHLTARARLVETPMHALPDADKKDFVTRAAEVESVKGAIQGLRLARNIVTHTMQEAERIRADARTKGGGEKEKADA